MNMQQFKSVINSTDTRAGRIFDLCIQALIMASLAGFALGTMPGLSEGERQALRIFEIVSVLIFSAEYLLRIWASAKKTKYIFSIYGIIDLLAILPFYLAAGVDLRSLRILRLFRLFRVIKLFRYSKALHRFVLAFRIGKEEIFIFFMATVFLLFLSAAGIYLFENPVQPETYTSIFSSLWWSVITLTTVGYGDMVPVTIGGKVFTFFILMIGIGIVSIPAGILASSLTKAREMEKEKGIHDQNLPDDE